MPFEKDGTAPKSPKSPKSPSRRKSSVSKSKHNDDFDADIEPAFAVPVMQHGYLQKLSSGMAKRYQNRYFELAGTYLKYFDNAFPRTKATIKGVIHLDGLQSCSLEEEKVISISLVDGRTLKLKAKSEENAKIWIANIKENTGCAETDTKEEPKEESTEKSSAAQTSGTDATAATTDVASTETKPAEVEDPPRRKSWGAFVFACLCFFQDLL
jgi:hypothetical protein